MEDTNMLNFKEEQAEVKKEEVIIKEFNSLQNELLELFQPIENKEVIL